LPKSDTTDRQPDTKEGYKPVNNADITKAQPRSWKEQPTRAAIHIVMGGTSPAGSWGTSPHQFSFAIHSSIRVNRPSA